VAPGIVCAAQAYNAGMIHAALVALASWFVLASPLPTSSQALPMTPPATATVQVSGTYDSNWGPVHLEQSGARIVGTYECCGGGRIAGTLDGSVIFYEWHQSAESGRGRWRVRKNGASLVGTWGSGKSATSGGPWNLVRRQVIAK
jgi:hypothetical protein